MKSIFIYNSESGVFNWIKRKGNIAGNLSSHGYIVINISGQKYYAHRLVWVYFYGETPEGEIDHINGIRNDNRICNLRVVPRDLNQRNRARNKNNNTGFNGVSWYEIAKKWRARIKFQGKDIHLGFFDDLNEAIEARKLANTKYGFHENHGRN